MKTIIITLLLGSIITIGYSNIPGGQSRSAKTGRYVTKSYAQKHPSTTYTTKKR